MRTHHALNGQAEQRDPEIGVEESDLFVPSFAQERLWFLDQLEPDSYSYNIFNPMMMWGELDVSALHYTVNALVERHEVLRTTFVNVGGRPMQVIAPHLAVAMPVIDLSSLPLDERQETMDRLIVEAMETPFDLRHGPLLRMYLLRFQPQEHMLIVAMHHIVADNGSVQIFWRDFYRIYNAAIAGTSPSLPELSIQYADFAEWQRNHLQGDVLAEHLRFWRRQLDGAPAILDLPTDHRRPVEGAFRGGQHFLQLSPELSRQLRALAQHEGVTLFMLLLAAFQTLLMRITRQEDIVVGTPIAARTRIEIEQLMGPFANILPMRTHVSGEITFRDLLRQVREVCLSAYEHQDLPFEKLVEELNPERHLGYQPIFQAFFVVQDFTETLDRISGLELKDITKGATGNKFDLGLGLWNKPGALNGDFEYNADIFTPETIARLAGYFQTLLASIVAHPDQSISHLEMISPTERNYLFECWRAPAGDFPAISVPEVFERQTQLTPDAVALTWRDQQISFAELDRRANQVAHFLRRQGIGPEVCVGVCLERSPDFAVSLLGVMKSGGVYLPFDPTSPEERRLYMLNDAQAPLVITQTSLRHQFAETPARIVCLDTERVTIELESDERLATTPHPEDTAYVIYTSGSTGTPKGVVVPHRALVDRIYSIKARYGLNARDRLLQFVSMSFDVSLEEIFPTWASGATVVLLPAEGVPSLAEVSRLTQEQCLTVLDLPPSYWHEWVANLVHSQSPIPSSVRLVILGSESSSPATLAIWEQLAGDRVAWCNVYGLTETTLIAMTYGPGAETQGWDQYTSIPIGHPLANTQVYVLDGQFQPVPIGVAGELYIGGPGLARGYLGRPDLTAERFISDPFNQNPGVVMYRTGDLVRTLPNGMLEFLGRVDTQVKVRGFRIELEEVETLLRQYPGVREAVVLAIDDGSSPDRVEQSLQGATRLAGFIVTTRKATSLENRLQRYLEKHLPAYMVPSPLVLLETLPRTPGGKVDRKELVALLVAQATRSIEEVELRTPTEAQLAAIWERVLRSGPITRSDDFFKLGGHSLQATQVVARIREEFGVEIPVRAMYDTPTVAALAEQINRLRRDDLASTAIQPVPRDGMVPLSFAQQRLWFLDQLEPNSPLYNIPGAISLRGKLDVAALERSINALIRRHEPLRTTFAVVDGQPVQRIAPVLTLTLPIIDLAGIGPADDRNAAVNQIMEQEAQRPFDLMRGPLVHIWLLRLGSDQHVLLLTLHHSVADGWSSGIVFRELNAFYSAFLIGATPDLPPLPVQYADYAVWQREWLRGVALEESLAYWQKQLAGAPPVLELPTDYPRPAEISYRGSHLTFALPTTLGQELRALAQREGVTYFMLLFAAFLTLLARYTGQEDIVVGTPVAGRQRRETEDLIGFFINTLALRVDLAGNPTFATLLQRVREVCLNAYDHQDVPFEKLVDELEPDRSLSYTPLFQVVFALQHAAEESVELPGLTLQQMEWASETAKFDLTFNLTEAGDDLYAWVEFNTDIFAPDTITRLFRHWQHILVSVVADPRQPIAAIPLLSDQERRQMVVDWNATQTEYPRQASIQQVFEAQAEAAPEAIAVVCEDAQLTYGELNRRANQLAHYLRALKVGAEMPVGLCVERSPDLVIGLLGILKAGGFYVPIDPAYPRERIGFMSADAGVGIVLTKSDLQASLPSTDLSVILLDRFWPQIALQPADNPVAQTTAKNLAYVNYTSGSTGLPKGVCIPHQAVVRLVKENTFARLTADEVFLQFATITFDAATLEIWGPLLNGGRLVIFPPGTPDLEELGKTLVRYHVTTLWLTAGLFHLMVEEQLDSLRYVRQLLAGGDVLSVPHVCKVLQAYPGNTLINGYGPTEGTTFTCCYPMTGVDQVGSTVSIGKPIANTQVYILDSAMQPVPIGVPGELYIGGDGLARGYLRRPELTSAAFVNNPFNSQQDARLYRTGDLARYLADGNIEFLGRIDQQVKINGYRIEPGEVETVLGQHPHVRDCVVIARRDGAASARLIAYVTLDQEHATSAAEMRVYLKERLPDYMVPSAIIEMVELPLNANGKVERSALPAPESVRSEADAISEAPHTAMEETLATIWAEVLRLNRVGIHDNFFEIGGDSILSMQIISRARRANIRITPKQLFQHQTVAELATVVAPGTSSAADQEPVSGMIALTPIQHWFFEQDLADFHHYNQAMLLETPVDVDAARLEQALRHLIVHHDTLRLRFTREANGWRQRNAGSDEAAPAFFDQIDLTSLSPEEQPAAIESRATAFQASLNIEQGPLIRAVLFRLGDHTPDRLLIAIHHLAVDAVSWRTLTEDLETAYRQLSRGEPVQLSPKTTSFQRWSELLAAYAQSEAVSRTADFWLDAARELVPRLPTGNVVDLQANVEGSARVVAVSLNAQETQALLQEVPKAYHTQINDVLLAALATAFRDWTGSPGLLVDLEGHGREPMTDDIDLSRTVGWFTTIYPVLLNVEGLRGPGEILPAIKEQLRRIPDHGITYGVLRYLSQDHGIAERLRRLPQAEVSFNYIGQLDGGAPADTLFKTARESSGSGFGERGRRRYLLDLLGSIEAGQLRIVWVYSERVHDRDTIEWVAQRYIAALREIIAHCLSPDAGGYTPSDFPLAQLDAGTLSRLSQFIGEEQ